VLNDVVGVTTKITFVTAFEFDYLTTSVIQGTPVKLIVGLGNPGDRYRLNRHNMGFLVLDELAKRQDIDIHRKGFDSCLGKGSIAGLTVILAQPLTFMNRSGEAVKRLVQYFKTDLDDLIVAHDDLDLPLGSVRIKAGGGHGGHKGLKSIIDHLGEPGFIRVRLGIGKPVSKEMVNGYVLESFTGDEMKILPGIVSRACDAVAEIVLSGAQSAMCKFNVRTNNKSNKEV
jgi:PTH1 family peptidyl-tRNA hydrolase